MFVLRGDEVSHLITCLDTPAAPSLSDVDEQWFAQISTQICPLSTATVLRPNIWLDLSLKHFLSTPLVTVDMIIQRPIYRTYSPQVISPPSSANKDVFVAVRITSLKKQLGEIKWSSQCTEALPIAWSSSGPRAYDPPPSDCTLIAYSTTYIPPYLMMMPILFWLGYSRGQDHCCCRRRTPLSAIEQYSLLIPMSK